MARKHTEDEVLRSLKTKHDIRIDGKEIKLLANRVFDEKLEAFIPNPEKRNDLGNGSQGKIDFLLKYCGYRKTTVDKFK
jgi:hypothetical protein